MRISVFGIGRVGRTIAEDLALEQAYHVSVFDKAAENLKKVRGIPEDRKHSLDFSDSVALKKHLADEDVVVTALPGSIAFSVLGELAKLGKKVVDISFFEEDARQLEATAKKNGASIWYDCGVAPGMSNVLTGYFATQLDVLEDAAIYVGGLPFERTWPFEYKAAWHPYDVIEEYLRPARIIEGGEIVEREPLTQHEFVDVPGVGTLEAFITDGLRSLLYTVPAKRMRELTMRYPGHSDMISFLKKSGFLSEKPVVLRSGDSVKPLDLTSELMKHAWTLEESDDEFTCMRVYASGIKDGKARSFEVDLFDRKDLKTGYTSMARTTGFTATGFARLLADGDLSEPGIWPPETLVKSSAALKKLLAHLKARNVEYKNIPSL